MTQLPREARDGLMRVWLEILKERHPDVSWIPAIEQDVPLCATTPTAGPVSA